MPINFLKGDRHADAVLQPGAEWVGVFEPGVELEGHLNVAGGAVRLNAHFGRDQLRRDSRDRRAR